MSILDEGMLAQQKEQADHYYQAGQAYQLAQPYKPSLRERLTASKTDLTKRLEHINNALDMLDKNPGFEQCLDLINKVY